MKNVYVTVTAQENRRRPLKSSVACLDMLMLGGFMLVTSHGETTFRISSLRFDGKTYKGQIGAFHEGDKVASQAFSDTESLPLAEAINKSLRKLATKLDVDLIPITHVTY